MQSKVQDWTVRQSGQEGTYLFTESLRKDLVIYSVKSVQPYSWNYNILVDALEEIQSGALKENYIGLGNLLFIKWLIERRKN